MNTSYGRLVTALLAVGALTATAVTRAQAAPPLASVAPNARAVTLRYKFVPGMTRAYQLTMDSDGKASGGRRGKTFPLKQHISAVLRQTVRDVRASDGAATLVTTFDSFTMTVNGQTIPLPKSRMAPLRRGTTMLMTPSGKVLSLRGSAGGVGGAMPGLDMSQLGLFESSAPLPGRPVKVGDTWESAIHVGLTNAQEASTYRLLGVDRAGGATHARIGRKFTGSLVAGPAAKRTLLPVALRGTVSGTGTELFDVGAGALGSITSVMDMASTLTPRHSIAGLGTMHFTMHLKVTMGEIKTVAVPAL